MMLIMISYPLFSFILLFFSLFLFSFSYSSSFHFLFLLFPFSFSYPFFHFILLLSHFYYFAFFFSISLSLSSLLLFLLPSLFVFFVLISSSHSFFFFFPFFSYFPSSVKQSQVLKLEHVSLNRNLYKFPIKMNIKNMINQIYFLESIKKLSLSYILLYKLNCMRKEYEKINWSIRKWNDVGRMSKNFI